MPMPKRSSVQDYFDQLSPEQRPHLEELRRLSRQADPEASEELKWNLPVYAREAATGSSGASVTLWMLQNFKRHCSLRFPPRFFEGQRERVLASGYEAGEGFIKLPYDREIPAELCAELMRARVEEFLTTGAGWSDA